MITDFRKWVSYLGNDDLAVYSFPFKITDLSEIVVVQLDISSTPPVIDFIERGDVLINIDSVEFDSVLGGGTVTLPANLPADKRIYIKLANDNPTQPTRLREQQEFKLKSIEDALDFIVNQVTRLTDRSTASLRFADHYSHVEETANLQIPEFPMANGMPIMDAEGLQLNMKPILTILKEQGVLQLIADAQADADLANLRLDLLKPRVDQAEVNINQLKLNVDNHEDRITALEALPSNDSGGIALKWYAPAGSGAVIDDFYGIEVFKFSQGADQAVKAVLKRATGKAITPNQKQIKIAWAATSNRISWTLITYLIKPGTSIGDTSNSHTSTVETIVPGPEGLVYATLNMSDVNGQINGLNVEKNDIRVLLLVRTVTANPLNDDPNDAVLLKDSTEVMDV